jgi:hypothetical protein
LNWSSQRNSKRAFRERVVADLRAGVALGEVGGVGGELVGDDAFLDVVLVGQAEVFLGRDVAEHGGAVPADHGGADAAGDVVVARRDVGGQRAEGVERGFACTASSCRSMFSLIMCIGTWPGPSIMTCTSCFQAIWVSSPRVLSSPSWASSLAS